MAVKITLKNRLKRPLLLAAALTTLSGCSDTRHEGTIGDAENTCLPAMAHCWSPVAKVSIRS